MQGTESQVGSGAEQQARVRLLRSLLRLLSLLTVGDVGLQLVFFLITRAWQMAAIAVCGIVFLAVMGYGALALRRGRLHLVTHLLFWAPLSMLVSMALLVEEAALPILVGVILLSVLLGGPLWAGRRRLWFGAALLLALALALVERLAFWPRFPVSTFIPLQIVFIALPVLVALVLLWRIVQGEYLVGSLRARLMLAFVSVVLMVGGGSVTASVVLNVFNGRQQVLNQLQSVVAEKEFTLRQRAALVRVALQSEAALRRDLGLRLVAFAPDSEVHRKLQAELSASLQQAITLRGEFDRLSLLDTQGRVRASTSPGEAGKLYTQQAFFVEGLKGLYFSPPVYGVEGGRTTLIVALPLIDYSNTVRGVWVGYVNLSILNVLMTEYVGLGTTGETFLINDNGMVITPLRSGVKDIFLNTQASQEVLQTRGKGSGRYRNYQGEWVLGVYSWVPELQVGLIAEKTEAEALQPIYPASFFTAGLILLGVLLAAGAGLMVTRTVGRSLEEVAAAAQAIAAGDLKRRAPVLYEDELGQLAQAFNVMAERLGEVITTLEERVRERTAEVEQRSADLDAAARVALDATRIQDLDALLATAVDLVAQHFNFYHAAIYLLDERRERLNLVAASSEGGKQLLARGFTVPLASGIIGAAVRLRTARVVHNVSLDPDYLPLPELPLTRAEIALPLQVGDTVIGVLEVEAVDTERFTESTVQVLSTLSAQLALAIQNVRLLQTSEQTLQELQRLYGEQERRTWQERLAGRSLAYRYTTTGLRPVRDRQQVREMLETYRTDPGSLLVPLRLRGQTLGMLVLKRNPGAPAWTLRDRQLVEAVMEQAVLALDNARLLDQTQARAERERQATAIVGRVRATTDFERILQIALQELARQLGASGVIHLGPMEGAE